VSRPLGRPLCNSLEHRRGHVRADVVVAFGRLGSHGRDAVFVGCWGRSYPMCSQCWDDTRRVAQRHRPALVIHDTTQ
jgi:hypothetical protein